MLSEGALNASARSVRTGAPDEHCEGARHHADARGVPGRGDGARGPPEHPQRAGAGETRRHGLRGRRDLREGPEHGSGRQGARQRAAARR